MLSSADVGDRKFSTPNYIEMQDDDAAFGSDEDKTARSPQGAFDGHFRTLHPMQHFDEYPMYMCTRGYRSKALQCKEILGMMQAVQSLSISKEEMKNQ